MWNSRDGIFGASDDAGGHGTVSTDDGGGDGGRLDFFWHGESPVDEKDILGIFMMIKGKQKSSGGIFIREKEDIRAKSATYCVTNILR